MASRVETAQKELNGKVMGKAGVSGTAIGMKNGGPCLKVYVEDSGAAKRVPKQVGGFPVVVEKTGSFRRLDG